MTNEIEKTERELTPQEVLFCDAYGDAESETYGNATKSAELAKYSQPHNAGWKLKQRQVVKDRLNEIYEKNRAGVGKVMSDLEYERLLAIAKGDISSAIRASELQGKRLGAFSDKHIFRVGDDEQRRQTKQIEAEQLERIRRLATLDLENRYLVPSSPTEQEFPEGEGHVPPDAPA
jgi:phage terminase small subunit